MFPIKTALAVGSAGVRQTTFTGLADPLQANSGFPADLGTSVPDTVFYLGGANLRHVTERQAPSVINSVDYFLSNWDGSARETFNLETAVGRSQRAPGRLNRVRSAVTQAVRCWRAGKVCVPAGALRSPSG